MSNTQGARRDHFVIFGRYPVVGQTKTRLIPHLGEIGAAELQRELTEKIIHMAYHTARKKRGGFDVEFCFESGSLREAKQWIGIPEIAYSKQPKGDLGEKMHAVFVSSHESGYSRTVLVGTDINEFSPDYINDAFRALNDNDLVVGPTTDGGYGLIGMKSPHDVFGKVPYGTSDVLKKTLEIADKKQLKSHCLPTISDIDTIEDLDQLSNKAQLFSPFISVIIPTLNEAKRIVKTIEHAQTPSTEVIVVDGGSLDKTVSLAKGKDAEVIRYSPGRARQQNKGAQCAKGKVLLFLHADTLLPEHFDRIIFQSLLDHEVSLGAFRFKTDLRKFKMRWIETFVNLRSSFLRLPYGDQGLFMKRDVFNKLKGFQPVLIAEDLLLVRRANKIGRVKTVPSVITTSARRWRQVGVIRTTLINTLIACGLILGVAPHVLAPFYHVKDHRGG